MAYRAIEKFKSDHPVMCSRDPRFYLRLKRYRGDPLPMELGARPKGTPVSKSNMRALASREVDIPLDRAADTPPHEPAGDLINRVAQPEFDMTGFNVDQDADRMDMSFSDTLLDSVCSPTAVAPAHAAVSPTAEEAVHSDARALAAKLSNSSSSASPELPPFPSLAPADNLFTPSPPPLERHDSSSSSVIILDSSPPDPTTATQTSSGSHSREPFVDLTVSSQETSPTQASQSISTATRPPTLLATNLPRPPIEPIFPHSSISDPMRHLMSSAFQIGYTVNPPRIPAPVNPHAAAAVAASAPVFGHFAGSLLESGTTCSFSGLLNPRALNVNAASASRNDDELASTSSQRLSGHVPNPLNSSNMCAAATQQTAEQPAARGPKLVSKAKQTLPPTATQPPAAVPATSFPSPATRLPSAFGAPLESPLSVPHTSLVSSSTIKPATVDVDLRSARRSSADATARASHSSPSKKDSLPKAIPPTTAADRCLDAPPTTAPPASRSLTSSRSPESRKDASAASSGVTPSGASLQASRDDAHKSELAPAATSASHVLSSASHVANSPVARVGPFQMAPAAVSRKQVTPTRVRSISLSS